MAEKHSTGTSRGLPEGHPGDSATRPIYEGPLPSKIRQQIQLVSRRQKANPADVERMYRERLWRNTEDVRQEEAESAAQMPKPDEPEVERDPGIRSRRVPVAEIRIKLDRSDARIVRMLRRAYALPAAQLVRQLLRSEYASVYGKRQLFPAEQAAE